MQGGTLTDLRLASNNDITQFGWRDLFNALTQRNKSVVRLDINSNSLGRFGVARGNPLMALAGVKLDYLNISGSQLNSSHVDALAAELKAKDTKVAEVKLDPGNNLDSKSAGKIRSALS